MSDLLGRFVSEREPKLAQAYDDPKVYKFLDLSQINSRNFGQDHWDRVLWAVQRTAEHPRPVNNTKIYGDGAMNFGSGGNTDSKAWKDIWGCGQGIGAVKAVVPTADLVSRLGREYRAARERLLA